MAIEPKRGCGYRKVNGLYMVGSRIGRPCDRMPFLLSVCNCCGQGVKQARGWTWIDVAKFFQGAHTLPIGTGSITPPEKLWACFCHGSACVLCREPEKMGRAGLLWVGEKFYKTPESFLKEGFELGVSRRIKAVPQGFKIGETCVMLAHSKAVTIGTSDGIVHKPGIFYVWFPQRIEKIVLESSRGTEEIAALEKRGIIPVFVPDNDVDHRGNVHDDFERDKSEEVID